MRDYSTLKKLRAGEIVEVDGISLRMIEGEIEPGDFYVGERNQGAKLAICREVVYSGGFPDYIHAEDPYIYSYDYNECVKVEEAC